MRWALAAVLVVAACGRKTSDRTCERTIEAAAERVAAEQRKSGVPSAGSAIVAGTRLTMIASCEAEKWSDEVLRCIETARLEVDVASCQNKLTHEQWESLQKKLSTLRASMSPPEPVPDAATVAVVVDAPVAITVDAAVVPPPPVDAAVVHVPPIDAAPAEDCSKSIVDPRSAACRQQYCKGHTNDPRCMIE